MTIEMKEIFNHQIDTYKQLRSELTADTELSDQEKDWMHTNIQQSIHHQTQILELEIS